MSTEYITTCLRFTVPVRIRATVENYEVQHEDPDANVPIWYTLAFHLGARRLSRINYSPDSARALLKGGILDDPVFIALMADKEPGRERGLLRVALAAAPTTDLQEALLVDAHRSLPEGMALWNLPEDQVGFGLGECWLPAAGEVLEPIPIGEHIAPMLRKFEDSCKPFFDRILFGDPAEEVERLLRSI